MSEKNQTEIEMIKHIVMFKLQEEVNRKSKIENLKEICARANELKDKISEIVTLEAKTNDLLAPESNYDFVLICDFESIDKLNAYQVHPDHVGFGKFITPLRDLRACIDYEYIVEDNK